MRLTRNILKLLINKFIKHKSNGKVIYEFCNSMGIAYIKLAQILAMQNIGDIFTESDRQDLLHICDDCKQISYKDIKRVLLEEYGSDYKKHFRIIKKTPIGSASISQVHLVTLYNGDKAVIKIKRKDITETIDKDIRFILFCSKYFGKLFGFNNYIGSKQALSFYERWLREETDFKHEIDNIEKYTNFANSVNNKVKNCVNIKVPKLYKELCTENIIVMEYIPYKTINNNTDKYKIINGINSYIQLSFYALLNDKKVVWHGDPHGGNIYIDDNNNIGFLDYGLVFELSKKDSKLTKELFFTVYLGKSEHLINILRPYFKDDKQQFENFKQDVESYCIQLKNRPLTAYFMDLVLICFKYNINPPDYLYGMAKAFACLGGIDTIYNNDKTGKELLDKQITEYIIKNTLNKGKQLVKSELQILLGILTLDIDKVSNEIIKEKQVINRIIQFIV